MAKAPQNWGTNSRDAMPLSAGFSVDGSWGHYCHDTLLCQFDLHPSLALSLGPFVPNATAYSLPPSASA
jgi:hypothetical protein